MSSKKTWWLIGLALLILFVAPRLVSLYTDFLWFDAQALASVFWTTLGYRAVTLIAAGVLVAGVLYASLRYAEKRVRSYQSGYERSPITAVALVLGGAFSTAAYAAQWPVVLRYANSFSFAATDPVFGKDVAFYVYQLPFFELVVSYASLLVGLAFLTVLGVHLSAYRKDRSEAEDVIVEGIPQSKSMGVGEYVDHLKEHAYPQLLILAGVFVLVNAASYVLARYQLLFSGSGAVYGAGYAEHFVQLPALSLLAALSVLGALVLFANVKWRSDKAVVAVLAVLVGASLLASGAGMAVQGLVVEPDELNKERPYLEHEISATRAGFGLDAISQETLNVSETLTTDQLSRHRPTIDNARLWDDRPLLTTLNELQIFRSYYTFKNVDVDRYETGGDKRLMMLAGREIDLRSLPANSRTWVNEHLVYTHGFGAVMSPASRVTSNNLPELVIKDIPPESSVDIMISQPRIYYGENTRDYTVANTQTRELDYPSGDQNTYTHYDGDGGVQLTGALRQAAYAVQFRAPQILLSGSITSESRIQYDRQVTQRARKLAPFLQYDNDPYLVASDGGLYWVQDAYTTTDKYPYSRPVTFNGQRANYVRNSAKAVIDAYTGDVTFYIADEKDPLINTYRSAYPDLFESLDEMPQGLQQHLRYPQDLFSVQGERYRDYHMQDPGVFYNKEDSWRIPNELVRGREQPLEPYYQVMQLPGEDEAEFVQVQPFIPGGRENLIGWLAARSDGEHYGEIRAYHFSKQELTYGPMQVESRIDQDTGISQQITLWSRSGSGVIRGNLLVIPIENTILYVEPLFLESTDEGSLPQLMRVIAVHADRLAMAPTLNEALAAITGEAVSEEAAVVSVAPGAQPQLLSEVRSRYDQARDALQRGDFAEYARHIDALEELLANNTEE